MKVYDASAIVALIMSEPGAAKVEEALVEDDACICAVNWCEVVTSTVEAGAEESAVLAALAHLPLQIVALDEDLALRAARLRPATRSLGLSMGDRCCIALGQMHGATIVTADRPWLKLKLAGCHVVAIR